MFIAFTLLLLALFSHAQEEQLPPWSYSHPEKWPGKYCVSNDNRQSPISFRDVSMQPRESRALRMNGNCTLGRGTKAIMDLGHRQISAGDTALNGCFVVHPMSNKEQAGVFKVDRIHLHTRGEHAIGASVEDAEMHIVMSSVVNASNKMVLGVLIREAKGEQQADARLEHTLRGFLAQASREGTAWDYSAGLRELLPGSARQGRALLYDGSLTTPTCDPVVSWVVFETPARVSAGLIQSLRQLQLNRTGERFNNRPLQNATGRKVTPVELIEATAHVKKAPAVHNHTLPPKASSRTMAPIHGLVDTAASPSVGVLSGNTFIILLIIVSVVVAWKFVRSARASDVAAGVAPPTAAPRRNYGSV